MEDALQAIITAARQPYHQAAVVTDSSFLLIYPPERELDIRSALHDRCYPELKAAGIPYEQFDLTGFLFSCFTASEIERQANDEFIDYDYFRRGLASRVERRLIAQLTVFSQTKPHSNFFLVSTASLFPLVRFGEVLRQLRDLQIRLFVSFPGEERGGKPHFMNEPDGGNYLASKITFKF